MASSDESRLRALFRRNSDAETTRYFHPFPLVDETAVHIASHCGLDRYYVAAFGHTLVGLSMLRGWDEGYIVPSFGLLVDREWRGQGVGSGLIDFTLNEAHGLGVSRVRLSVYESHESAVRLYRSRGFVETSRAVESTTFGEDNMLVMIAEIAD